jgi:hypothetical protein
VSVDLPVVVPTEANKNNKNLPSYPPHDPSGTYHVPQQQQQQQQQQQGGFVPITGPAVSENEVPTGNEQSPQQQQVSLRQPELQANYYRQQQQQQQQAVRQTEVVNQPAVTSTGEGVSNEVVPGISIRTEIGSTATGSGSGSPAVPSTSGSAATGGGLAIDQRIQALPKDLDLLTLAKSVGGVETFLALVQEAGLVETLSGPGEFVRHHSITTTIRAKKLRKVHHRTKIQRRKTRVLLI